MKQLKALIVESDSQFRLSLARCFDRNGYQVLTASTVTQALSIVPSGSLFDVVLANTDGGILAFQNLISRLSPCEKIFALGDSPTGTEVNVKPIAAFIPRNSTPEEVLRRAERSKPSPIGPQIIGDSSPMLEVQHLINQVASSESTILISGASGTGKELVARAIHMRSPRCKQPFVAINCGAIPAELLESELFGHVKGAFTGAIGNRVGRFEFADQGTIFLDEIGDLPPAMQVKLLRVLQEKTFEPVGSPKSLQVSVRVIAATNRDLESMVAQGTFREDLYYRLNVIPLLLPKLRERPSDIPLLLTHFLTKHSRAQQLQFSQESLDVLVGYPWPGNVRELENLVERICVLKKTGVVMVSDLPVKYREPIPEVGQTPIPELHVDFNTAVDQFENQLILRALEKTGWNRNQAAALLRLNRTTLVEKIKKKGLRPANGVADLNF